MKTFAVAKKPGSPSPRRSALPVPRRIGPDPLAQRAQIHQVLASPRVQAKLTVGPPDDEYAREAERVADEVMRMPDPNGGEQWAQRTCLECEEEQVQRQTVEEPEPDEELE